MCLARLYDGDMLLAELDAYGQVRAEYMWGSLEPVARIAGGQVQLYVCDALGHVRALIDAETGQITDRYDYDAWGMSFTTAARASRSLGTGRMGMSGTVLRIQGFTMSAPANTTPAPLAGSNETR